MRLRLACFILVGGISFSFPALTQSLEDLENEVFNGSTSNSPTTEASSPAPVVEGQLDAPQVTDTNNTESEAEEVAAPVPKKPTQPKKEVDAKVYKDIDELLTGPKSIPLKHIFAVKYQYIFKKNRHEIIPFSLGIQPSDSFRKQISMGMSYLYHVTDSISVEALHVNFITNLSTGFSDDLSKNTGLEVERIEPVVSFGSALQWAPFRGKSATAENIYHFEGYMFLGGGMTKFEVGTSGMVMGGLGARLFMNQRSTLKFEVRDYYDLREDVGNRLTLVLGAGILLGASSL